MSGALTIFASGESPLKAVKLNTAFAERIARSGDTMTGPLILSRDPLSIFEAATKQYVDTKTASSVAGFLPLTGGTLTGPLNVGGSGKNLVALQPGATLTTAAVIATNGGGGLTFSTSKINFFNSSTPNVDGSRGGNVALTNLLIALDAYGLINDVTT